MKYSILAILLSIFISNLHAQEQNITSLAIQGYDPVVYFTENKATQGSAEYQAVHEEVTYFFSSEANKVKFVKSPEKYVPQYGGFCATGVATANAKFPVDPETFTLADGKLYLFYNGPYKGEHFNGKEPWLKDEPNLIRQADKNWKSLKSN